MAGGGQRDMKQRMIDPARTGDSNLLQRVRAVAPAWALRRRPGSSRRTRSTRAPGRRRSTPRATATPARSSARPGPADATAAPLASTAATTTSGSGPRHVLQQRLHARGLGAEGDPKNDVGIVGTWAGNGPMLWVDHLASRHHLTLGGSLSTYLDSGHNPIVGQWQHVAATFDGPRPATTSTALRSRAALSGGVGNSNTWRIGAYGSRPGRLLRRAHRRGPHLRPRAVRRRDPDRRTAADIADPGRRRRPGTSPSPRGPRRRSRCVDRIDRRQRRRRLHGSTGRRRGGDDDGDDVHRHRPRVLHGYQLGVEASTPPGTSRRGRLQRGDDALRRPLGSSPHTRSRRDRARSPTTRPGTVTTARSPARAGRAAGTAAGSLRRRRRPRRPGQPRHLLPDRLHARGLGPERHDQEGRRGRRHLGRQRPDAVGRPSRRPQLPHARRRPRAYLDSGQSPSDGQWQHVAATTTAPPPATTSTASRSPARAVAGSVGTSNTWRIGAYGGSPGGFFDGVVDDVRIYNRALSAARSSST